MNEIPQCKDLPENITKTIRDLGKQWNLAVPKIKPETIRKWDDLIDEWLSATDIPIIVRKNGGKIPDILKNEMSIAMILKSEEKGATYKKTLNKYSINKKGWKLCHKNPVGLNKGDVKQIDIEKLNKSFLNFMKPSNFFLVPKKWGGLEELK